MRHVYVIGEAVKREEDYYRDDEDAVLRCLKGEGEFSQPITLVYGPRRCGKTSFLNRIHSHAKKAGIPCRFISLKSAFEELETLGREVSQMRAGLLLFDEAYELMGRHEPDKEDEKQRKRPLFLEVVNEIASRETVDLRCIVADVPGLRELLRAEGEALEQALLQSGVYLIGGFSKAEAGNLVCQTKTERRNESLRSQVHRAIEDNLVSGVAIEIACLGQYLREQGILDPEAFRAWFLDKPTSAERILRDLGEPEKLLMGLIYYKPKKLRKDYLTDAARTRATALCRFGLCEWSPGKDGPTLELRGLMIRAVIPDWKDSRANRPPEEIERETLREVLTESGVTFYKGPGELPPRGQWVIHHVSDITLGRYGPAVGSDPETSMHARYVQHVRALPPDHRPSVAVVSGDLTSVGSHEEWLAAKRFLGELRRLLMPLSLTSSDSSYDQLVVVPGEHDQNWKVFERLVGEEHEGQGSRAKERRDTEADQLRVLDKLSRDPDALFEDFREVCEKYIIPPFESEAPERSAVYLKDARVLIVPFNSAASPSSMELGGPHFSALVGDRLYKTVLHVKAEVGRRPGMGPTDPTLNLGVDGVGLPLSEVGRASNDKTGGETSKKGVDVEVVANCEAELRFMVGNDVGVIEAAECRPERIRARSRKAITRAGGDPNNTMLRIAVCHHNVHQQQDYHLVDLVGAKRFTRALAMEGFSLLLHGHKHVAYRVHEHPGSESTSLVTVAAASLGDIHFQVEDEWSSERKRREEPRERTRAGFNELVIRHDTANGLTFKVAVRAWEWNDEKGEFTPGLQSEYTLP